MSVPLHERKPSKMEYLNQTLLLETEILQIVKKTPKAYQRLLGTTLFNECVVALRHGKTANSIFVQNQDQLDRRQYELTQMRGAIDAIPCHVHAWAELMQNCSSIPNTYKSTLSEKEERIARKCESIIKMIDGLKRSDRNRFKAQHAEKSNDSDRPKWIMIRYLKHIDYLLTKLTSEKHPPKLPSQLKDYPLPEKLLKQINNH